MADMELTNGEREFFALVNRASLLNPFSNERSEVDLKLAGLPSAASGPGRVKKAIQAVNERIRQLEKDGRDDISQYSGRDRELLEKAFLFELFYRFRKQFDELIESQIETDDVPARISFYNDAFFAMQKRGFNEEDFRRYFALAFQLRRAFYFIGRSLVGNSASMKSLRLNLWNNVFTHNLDLYDRYLWNRMEDYSTLILGETGTGKGAAALAIGRSGFIPLKKKSFEESFTQSFISLNLSQFPETLIESALFGHKKGAFTGAIENYQGIFEQCSPYGAILLDEIGEVSKPIQIKLLQVIQDRVFSPVGSQTRSRFNGRVIAATNRPLEKLRGKGFFRDDFYYRLCSDIIVVPPLRQRVQEDPTELDVLLDFTIKRLVGRSSPELVQIVREVIDRQLGNDYPWPGNVRELEQCVRRVLLKGIYTGDAAVTDIDLCRSLTTGIEQGNIDANSLTSGYCYLLYQRHRTFEEVARRTGLDRRTVKKYIQDWASSHPTDDPPV